MAKKTKSADLSIEEKLEQALVVPGYEPYKIPDNWCWVRMNSISNFERGITFPASAKEKEKSFANIPCLRTANVQETLDISDLIYVDKTYMKNNPAKLVKKKDILMSIANSKELVGKTSLINSFTGPMTFGGFVMAIRSKIVADYLFYYLRNEFYSGRFIGDSTQTTNIANINSTMLGQIETPVPPLAEQQRIVERIESLFSKLDEAKEKAQEVIDSFEARKAAILHKAFSGELTAKWREENGVGIESWERKRISECCKLGSGGTPSRKKPNYYIGDIPWIKTGEINWNTVNYSEESITQEAIDNSSAKVYAPGAVLVAMYGMGITRGKAAILGIEAATNQAVCVLQPKEYLFNRYLYFFFMCNYWDIREQAVGGNQLNLSATIIGKLNIDIPNLEEQYVITELLDSIIEKEYQTKQIAESIIDQIETMKKAILARAFRGELGTNDPEEESAVELLKQILTGE